MPFVEAGQVRLCYETFGHGRPLVLISGLSLQMVLWDVGFCEALANEGFHVIRFDNRDVGLSTRFRERAPVPLDALVRAFALGHSVNAPYRLEDMADDVAHLLDALGIADAHVVGSSMGGMIGQWLALRHPERVRSLTSIMSTTGARRTLIPTPTGFRALLARAPTTAAETESTLLRHLDLVGGPRFPQDREQTKALARLCFERGLSDGGAARHFAAVVSGRDRTPLLQFVRARTLVIHGTADPLIRPMGGYLTARSIPGARLLMIHGMGHDLPPGTWPTISQAVRTIAGRSG